MCRRATFDGPRSVGPGRASIRMPSGCFSDFVLRGEWILSTVCHAHVGATRRSSYGSHLRERRSRNCMSRFGAIANGRQSEQMVRYLERQPVVDQHCDHPRDWSDKLLQDSDSLQLQFQDFAELRSLFRVTTLVRWALLAMFCFRRFAEDHRIAFTFSITRRKASITTYHYVAEGRAANRKNRLLSPNRCGSDACYVGLP